MNRNSINSCGSFHVPGVDIGSVSVGMVILNASKDVVNIANTVFSNKKPNTPIIICGGVARNRASADQRTLPKKMK